MSATFTIYLFSAEVRSVKPNLLKARRGLDLSKGPSLYYVRTSVWVGGQENGNFLLFYVVKKSLRRWVGGSEKPQNIKMAPKSLGIKNYRR